MAVNNTKVSRRRRRFADRGNAAQITLAVSRHAGLISTLPTGTSGDDSMEKDAVLVFPEGQNVPVEWLETARPHLRDVTSVKAAGVDLSIGLIERKAVLPLLDDERLVWGLAERLVNRLAVLLVLPCGGMEVLSSGDLDWLAGRGASAVSST